VPFPGRVEVKIPTLTSQNKSEVGIGLFLRRYDGAPGFSIEWTIA
jgi:hypothetical protein